MKDSSATLTINPAPFDLDYTENQQKQPQQLRVQQHQHQQQRLNEHEESSKVPFKKRTVLIANPPPHQHHQHQQHAGVEEELVKLPAALTEAYYQARQLAPEVVHLESPPERFTRVEATLSGAANRLALYWQLRKKVYGDRMFTKSLLDVTSGQGILNEHDLAFLRLGALFLLPCNAVVVDHSQLITAGLEASELPERRRRCILYLWTKAAATCEGITVFRLYHDQESFDFETFKFTKKLLQQAMPLRLIDVHICCFPPKGGGKHVAKIVARQAVTMVAQELRMTAKLHIASSPAKLCLRLQAFGYKKEDLSPNLGGTLGCEPYLLAEYPGLLNVVSGPAEIKKAPQHKKPVLKPPPPTTAAKPSATSLAKKKKSALSKKVPPPVASVRPLALMELASELSNLPEAAAYREALQIAPEIVESESDPAMFLRLGNPKAAAMRLALYWQHRKRLFQDRAFRSLLDLSGEGCLSPEDLEFFRNGFNVNIPDDRYGHKVFFVDEDRFTEDMKLRANSRFRCLTYWLTAAGLATPLSQTEGVVFLRVLRSSQFDAEGISKLMAMMEAAMPTTTHAVHVLCIPRDGSRVMFAETLLPVFLQQFGKSFASKSKVHLADNETGAGLLPKLQLCGFLKKNLPECVGGQWKYFSFEKWLDQHREGQNCRKLAGTAERVAAVVASVRNNALDSLAEAAERARAEDRKCRKRQMDAIYARKRRVREKDEEKDLQKNCVELSRTNLALQKENSRLEQLLADAKTKVSLVEYGMSIASNDVNDEEETDMESALPQPPQKRRKTKAFWLEASDASSKSSLTTESDLEVQVIQPPTAIKQKAAAKRKVLDSTESSKQQRQETTGSSAAARVDSEDSAHERLMSLVRHQYPTGTTSSSGVRPMVMQQQTPAPGVQDLINQLAAALVSQNGHPSFPLDVLQHALREQENRNLQRQNVASFESMLRERGAQQLSFDFARLQALLGQANRAPPQQEQQRQQDCGTQMWLQQLLNSRSQQPQAPPTLEIQQRQALLHQLLGGNVCSRLQEPQQHQPPPPQTPQALLQGFLYQLQNQQALSQSLASNDSKDAVSNLLCGKDQLPHGTQYQRFF